MNYLAVALLSYSFLCFSCEGNTSEKNKQVNKQVSDDETTSKEEESESKVVPEKLYPREYIAWMDDVHNGLKVEKTIGEFTYMFQYKPVEYVAVMDIKKDSVKKTEFEKKIREYNGLQYYNFRISMQAEGELLKKNIANERAYYGRIQYFSFDMQKDMKLIDNKDTLDCVLFHFERVFGLAPYATFLLGFPVSQNKGNKTLCYEDKIFGAGKIYLAVKSKNIKNVPAVIVN